MKLYLFDLRRADGIGVCLETAECSDDLMAKATARDLLAQHPSCRQIAIYCDDCLIDCLGAA